MGTPIKRRSISDIKSQPNILKSSNNKTISNKILSKVQADIKDYIQFYKYRREVDNILVKISLTFYNELLTIANVKNNSSKVISYELQKINIETKLKTINNLLNNISPLKLKNNYQHIKEIINKNNNNIDAFSIINLSDLLTNISTKMYLSNVLTKKNYISIKKLDISNNISKILENLNLKQYKTTKTNTNTNTNIKKYHTPTTNIINTTIKYIDESYIFKNKIDKYDDNLNEIIKNIENFKLSKNKLKNSPQFKEALKENIDKNIENFEMYVKEFNKLLNYPKHVSNQLVNINKRFLYKFIVVYLNIINTFYKLYVYSYEWEYFIVRSS